MVTFGNIFRSDVMMSYTLHHIFLVCCVHGALTVYPLGADTVELYSKYCFSFWPVVHCSLIAILF